MKRIGFAAAASFVLAAAFALPASAQQSMSQLLNTAVERCLAQNQDKTNPPQEDITTCTAALAQVDAIRDTAASPTPHDANLFHFFRAFVQTSIGGGYAQIDGIRSSRVCSQAEASWSEIAQIVRANSPESFLVNVDLMRNSAISPITKCRAEKGTPAGAAPLP